MILNVGSINIDHVYAVPHMPAPGETLSATSYQRFLGGKGLNQSVAASHAGGQVLHGGAVGTDGDWALSEMEALGLSVDAVARSDQATGNAVIYVDADGENQIVILGGANQALDAETLRQSIEKDIKNGDWVVLQNETSLTQEVAKMARAAGARVAYSAAPFIEADALPMLPLIDLLAVNEGEAAALATALGKPLSDLGLHALLVTKGAEGASLTLDGVEITQDAFRVTPVDTTGAGDTFVGSLIARLDLGDTAQEAMCYAAGASALQVTQEGAASAIPSQEAVRAFLKDKS